MLTTEQSNNVMCSAITAEREKKFDEPVELEKAIIINGYGRFNVLLFLAALPIAWTIAFDTTTAAFILASAECELELTWFRKGVLVAFPYVGMILSASFWDYVTDYIGKKSLYFVALLADSLLNLSSTSVDSYHVFLLIKFISGIIVGGPFSTVMAYLTEFHSSKYKGRFSTWAGFLFTFPVIIPAVLGFSVIPTNWRIDVFGKAYKSWRIYLSICSIPPMIGVLTAPFLPESPKYLLTIGKHDEALKLLKRMYVMNTGKAIETYPIKSLLRPQKNKEQLSNAPFYRASLEKIRVSVYNTKLLFSKPYLPAFCFISFLQFGSMLGFHTMRLWVPHMFVILNNFDTEKWESLSLDRAPTMCEMLNRRNVEPARLYQNCTHFDDICIDWTVRPVIYQNSTIIATSAVFFSFLIGFISTGNIRKKLLLLAAFLISTVSSFGINWAQAPPYMLTLAAAIIVTTRITGNIVTAINAEVIPMPLRASSVSIVTAIGNLGAITGNFIFSALLDLGCLVAFFGLGCLFAVCIVLSILPLPKPVRISSMNGGA